MNSPIREVFLEIGGVYFGGGHIRVRTLLGSCVAITLWHPIRRIGGMCHYLLPAVVREPTSDSPPGLHADGAMQALLREIAQSGSIPSDYVAKLFGGGRMFGSLTPPAGSRVSYGSDICERNVTTGRRLLQENGFKIGAEDVGGAGYREVIFEIWSGNAWVRSGPQLPP